MSDWSHPYELLPLQQAALLVALDELAEGVREETPNDSPAIRQYLQEANIAEPAPWCAAFVNWCAKQAAVKKGVESPLEAVELEAYVPSYRQHGEAQGWVVPASEVAPGDLFLLYHRTKGRYAHIGFVHRPPSGSTGRTYKTVEGNTNEEGLREGVAVMARQRTVSTETLFMAWGRE